MIMLTTTGARTGRQHRVPLGALDIDGRLVVIASAMGAPKHPAWYHNIRRNPLVTVETDTETFEAMAALPPDRDKLFAEVIEREPGFADYQKRTTRILPVVELHRIDTARRMGDWLVEMHDWLRGELKQMRAELDCGTPKQLSLRCAGFCTALSRHHTGEARNIFPLLAERFPALAPTLAKLDEEHVVVARLQEEVQQLVDEEADPARLRAEFDRLRSELDSHFAYEERTLVAALNALLPAPG
ncbi:hemerythrin HHE cation binding protein [Amycolatopsis mediterranei S699]|uniref:Hemerythrin HHE cation binding protein n=2 Tax=Amycolatopsis mediterranei TaxID=33910 RepID=A0A0H3DF73_AMYMU|nr:hemerythrin HHE cation binding protein [Amycolatopsis mediterranei U32]AFO81059.1 hemerythrin HHE cation binding protein [Amycolatopsis mediterranei S699]AGT88187.1 hemerythrin HHE cation binding protein [Amycolatopsis mediterranei RB]KDO09472.1 hemerythrin [Amycolatopsis mediterranei]KDU90648.1 hemerythrin [Amycolatopsis mediterranei]